MYCTPTWPDNSSVIRRFFLWISFVTQVDASFLILVIYVTGIISAISLNIKLKKGCKTNKKSLGEKVTMKIKGMTDAALAKGLTDQVKLGLPGATEERN